MVICNNMVIYMVISPRNMHTTYYLSRARYILPSDAGSLRGPIDAAVIEYQSGSSMCTTIQLTGQCRSHRVPIGLFDVYNYSVDRHKHDVIIINYYYDCTKCGSHLAACTPLEARRLALVNVFFTVRVFCWEPATDTSGSDHSLERRLCYNADIGRHRRWP
jgi:hypothetical protein